MNQRSSLNIPVLLLMLSITAISCITGFPEEDFDNPFDESNENSPVKKIKETLSKGKEFTTPIGMTATVEEDKKRVLIRIDKNDFDMDYYIIERRILKQGGVPSKTVNEVKSFTSTKSKFYDAQISEKYWLDGTKIRYLASISYDKSTSEQFAASDIELILDCNKDGVRDLEDELAAPWKEELCRDGIDNNCNGEIDEDCDCSIGEKRECGTDIGECRKGIQTCGSDGKWNGECGGDYVGPIEEIPCNGIDEDCDGSDLEECVKGSRCFEGECCKIECSGKECGDDGCGGVCGECDKYPNSFCDTSGLCGCALNCSKKECGDDGCGGVCGECTKHPGSFCDSSGMCDCIRDCAGKCPGADDGCGGSCAANECPNICCAQECCLEGEICYQSSCCTPNCTDKCGGASDGCGGTCTGSCGTGKVCVSQACVACGDSGQPCCTSKKCNSGLSCQSGICQMVEWYDSSSNLTWKVNPSPNTMTWQAAKDYCSGLGSGWKLPSISELRSLIRGCSATQTGGSCGGTDSCLESTCRGSSCDGCEYNKGPSNGCYWPSEIKGNCGRYWSSSSNVNNANSAWYVDFNGGHVNYNYKTVTNDARCARLGP